MQEADEEEELDKSHWGELESESESEEESEEEEEEKDDSGLVTPAEGSVSYVRWGWESGEGEGGACVFVRACVLHLSNVHVLYCFQLLCDILFSEKSSGDPVWLTGLYFQTRSLRGWELFTYDLQK